MQNPDRGAGDQHHWDRIPGSRSGQVHVRLGDRMTVPTDKELNDLLDFSAMFSPPVPGSQPMKNGPAGPVPGPGPAGPGPGPGPGPSHPGPPPGSNLNTESGIYQGYKPAGIDEAGNWGTANPTGLGYESRMFDNRNFEAPVSGEPMPPYVNNSDIPPLLTKSSDLPYSSGFSSRDGPVPPPGMMGNNMPLSPELTSAGKTTCPPYYHYSKRPVDDPSRGARSSGKYTPPEPRKRPKVYSPSPDEYHQDSPRYLGNSPKNMYGDYFTEPPHSSTGDPWSSNNALPSSSYPSSMLPSGSHYSTAPNYTNMHHPHEMNYHPMSPNQDAMNMSSGLPPMSTFRGSSMPTTSSAYSSTSPSVNGTEMLPSRSSQGSSQTGDALGKALASIYPTEHTGSSYGGSNPSTPVSSPPPMSANPNPQWHRPTTQSTTSPHFESHLHSLQSRMEERLDDAIHVLRNHAEHAPDQIPGMPGHPGLPGMMPQGHSNGIMGSMGGYPPMPLQGHMDSHMGSNSGLPDGHRGVVSSVSTENLSEESSKSTDAGIKVEKQEKAELDTPKNESTSKPAKSANSGSMPSNPPSGGKRHRLFARGDRSESTMPVNMDSSSEPDDPNESPETKHEREKLRRQANNARERIRVRDINQGFRELGQMVMLHCGSSQPLTKLMIIQQAVNLITSLEQQVRERNLNPKAACLKRREEEKGEDMPGRLPGDDITQQAALADKGALTMRAVLPSDPYATAMVDPTIADSEYFQSHGTYPAVNPQVYGQESYHAERYIRGGYPSSVNGRGDNSDRHIVEEKSEYYVKGNNSLDVNERHDASDVYARGDNSSVVREDNSSALTVDLNKQQHETSDVYARESNSIAKEDNSVARGDNSNAFTGAGLGQQVVCDRVQETEPATTGASPRQSAGPSTVQENVCDRMSQTNVLAGENGQ
ncbi:transcription factor 4-like isoform X1 [Gigantopelta aegis]|uniref:transcription factor 4-like isoform X1 n=1 Tax=Gigantopelta aegis TaxID=1735272 RepID=UPI001B88D40A|nr:transcription factor 4-like isoform X1 [Gigantopelta aegis]